MEQAAQFASLGAGARKTAVFPFSKEPRLGGRGPLLCKEKLKGSKGPESSSGSSSPRSSDSFISGGREGAPLLGGEELLGALRYGNTFSFFRMCRFWIGIHAVIAFQFNFCH